MTIDFSDPVFGIDVSSHQDARGKKPIDWKKAKAAGVEFAWIKTTQGKTHIQPALQQRVHGCVEAGIPWGPYLFAEASAADTSANAIAQVDHFLKVNATLPPPELPPMLDFEWPKASLGNSVAVGNFMTVVCQKVEAETWRTPVVYAPAWWLIGQGLRKFSLPYPLMMSAWPSSAAGSLSTSDGSIQKGAQGKYKIDRLPNWPTSIWQYSETGRVPGFAGPVDLDVMDREMFSQLVGRDLSGWLSGAALGAAAALGLWWYLRRRDGFPWYV